MSEEGSLKIRPVNKPIHKPKESDKIDQILKEWQSKLPTD
jgi:site-specific DNA-methyltransferase (adenine-specific)/adenine-specific DNA-methyltransferase